MLQQCPTAPSLSAAVFALLHDYSRRLEWDTLLSAAYLDDGHAAAARNATSVCVGRWYLGRIALKTEYVTFDPPRLAAVKMINRPPFFETWAASIHHEDLDGDSSRVTYTWTFSARPRWLRWLLEPVMNRRFQVETQRRLKALAAWFRRQTLVTGLQPEPVASGSAHLAQRPPHC